MIFLRLLFIIAALMLMQCTPKVQHPTVEAPGAAYLSIYQAQQEALAEVAWSGNIGIVSRRIDQMVLPYRLSYNRDTLLVKLYTPFGTRLGEIEFNGGQPRIETQLPGVIDLEMFMPGAGVDSLEIAPAVAYSYFWGIPFISPGQYEGVGRISFNQQNLPYRVQLDSTGNRELHYTFRQLPDAGPWPKLIRYRDKGELQVTITIKEPQRYDTHIGSDTQL